MTCPDCESKRRRIRNVKQREGKTVRYCECKDCGCRYRTVEADRVVMRSWRRKHAA